MNIGFRAARPSARCCLSPAGCVSALSVTPGPTAGEAVSTAGSQMSCSPPQLHDGHNAASRLMWVRGSSLRGTRGRTCDESSFESRCARPLRVAPRAPPLLKKPRFGALAFARPSCFRPDEREPYLMTATIEFAPCAKTPTMQVARANPSRSCRGGINEMGNAAAHLLLAFCAPGRSAVMGRPTITTDGSSRGVVRTARQERQTVFDDHPLADLLSTPLLTALLSSGEKMDDAGPAPPPRPLRPRLSDSPQQTAQC